MNRIYMQLFLYILIKDPHHCSFASDGISMNEIISQFFNVSIIEVFGREWHDLTSTERFRHLQFMQPFISFNYQNLFMSST